MKWSKRHATGVTRLDEQHKLLFQMVEDYQQALAEGRGERLYSLFLNFLVHYCRDHFAREERLMEAYRCPVAQVNKMGHVQFVEVVTGFQRCYIENGFSAADAWSLTDWVEHWLDAHIGRIDVQLKGCVEGA
jgi:hemerythrin